MTDLERIVSLAEELVAQQKEVDEINEKLKSAKAHALRLEREDLPTLMAEVGLSEITLTDGSKVQIKEDLDAKITDKTRNDALRWLLDNGFGGLIKTNVSLAFGRGDHDTAAEVRDRLAQEYDGVELKEDVHHSTLKAFIRERMAAGDSIPMDLFNVYPYNKAIIKR